MMATKSITVCDKCGAEDDVHTHVFDILGSNAKPVEVDLCDGDAGTLTLGEARQLGRPHIKRRQPRKTSAANGPASGSTGRGGRRPRVTTLGDVNASKRAAKKTAAPRS